MESRSSLLYKIGFNQYFFSISKNISSQYQKYYAMKFSKYYQNFSQCSQGFVYKMFTIIDIDFGKSQLKHHKNCECCPVSQLIIR